MFHSWGQQVTQVRLLSQVHAISNEYNKNNMINELQIEDEDFHTELPEPKPEE